MSSNVIARRTLLRTLVVTGGAAVLGRVVAACSDNGAALTGRGSPVNDSTPSPKPTDGDEHVPGSSPPVNAGDEAPKVPNQVWETRAKQLDAEQQRLYGRGPFVRGDAGVMTGKENSHEPKAIVIMENGAKRVEVKVEHVMGKNGLDAGAPADGGLDAAKDGGDAGDAGKLDAGDAGKLDAGDAGDGGSALEAGVPPVHFITTIFLRGMVNGVDTVVGLWEFVSTDAAPPTVHFTLPAGVTSVTAWEWCTLHGLWKAPPLAL